MQIQEGTFIRYTLDGKEHHVPHTANNLKEVRAKAGGNYTTVKGFGVFNDAQEFDFYSSKEDIPAVPFAVNGAGAVSEETHDETTDPELGETYPLSEADV